MISVIHQQETWCWIIVIGLVRSVNYGRGGNGNTSKENYLQSCAKQFCRGDWMLDSAKLDEVSR